MRKAWLLLLKSESVNKVNKLVPRDVEVEHWPCHQRVNGLISCTGDLKKFFIWMKIHGLTQNS